MPQRKPIGVASIFKQFPKELDGQQVWEAFL